MKELLSFDLDQTLIETKKVHFEAWKIAFKQNKLIPPKKDKIIALLDGRNAFEVAKGLAPKLSINKLQLLRQDHHDAVRITAKYAKQISQAARILKKLKKRFKLALVSNCSHIEIDALLRATKFSKKLFDIIIGHGDVKRTKPFPDEIFKAERLLHENAKYHVGDSIYDILAAKKARVKSISVLTGISSRNKLIKYHPDFIIKNISYLPKLLSL